MKRSWPFFAETSAAAVGLMAGMPMLSTVTSVSFFSPHSLMYWPLNHLSYPGTKWFHWTMRSVFLAAFDFFGSARAAAPTPAAWISFRLERVIAALLFGLRGR